MIPDCACFLCDLVSSSLLMFPPFTLFSVQQNTRDDVMMSSRMLIPHSITSKHQKKHPQISGVIHTSSELRYDLTFATGKSCCGTKKNKVERKLSLLNYLDLERWCGHMSASSQVSHKPLLTSPEMHSCGTSV